MSTTEAAGAAHLHERLPLRGANDSAPLNVVEAS